MYNEKKKSLIGTSTTQMLRIILIPYFIVARNKSKVKIGL